MSAAVLAATPKARLIWTPGQSVAVACQPWLVRTRLYLHPLTDQLLLACWAEVCMLDTKIERSCVWVCHNCTTHFLADLPARD